jgi:hypothetical protein
VARRTRITFWYRRQVARVLTFRSERSLAVGRVVNALVSADELPGPGDFETEQKPIGRAWVRRVGGRNLWLWYRFTDEEVALLTLTTEPPVPLDDEPRSS